MSYDGSLKFDTKISTAEFAEGLKKIQEIAKSGLSKVEISIDSVNESVKESTKQISKNETQSEEWKSELNDLRTALSKLESKLDSNTTSASNLSDEIHNVDKKIDNLGGEVKETSKSVEKFDDTSKEASESVEKLGNTSSKTKGKLELLKTAADKVEDGFTGIIKTAGKAISTMAKAVTTGVGVVSTGALAIGTSAVKAGIDFESAFAGVEKTVDATDEQLSNLRKGLLDMSKEIPQSAADLSAIAESAGQLGIETNNIEKFTQVMANLGVATNMASDEAATSLARFANITGMPQKNFDKLGSTIVALGNNLATTESEIVDMSLRIAGTGKQVGMSESQIMSFSAALSSVGIEAEMGGSAFSTLLSKMQLATDKCGEDLDKFAKVAGISGGEFKKLFQKDATEAVSAFLKGLNKINENGGSAISTLDDMDLSEVRMRDTLLRVSSASDVFTKAMSTGTEAWKENNALTKEANKRYETLESKIQLMKNGIRNLGIAFKDSIDTDLRSAVQLGTKYIDELSKAFTDGGLQGAVTTAGDIFGEIATKAAENAPKMIDSALQFIDSFANGIRDNSSKLLNAGRSIVQAIIEGIINFAGYGSELIDGAVAIIQALITTISINSEELIKAGESIVNSIVNGIVTLANNAGTVVRGVVALIQSFIKSVKNNKDKLLTAAKEIVKAITDGLVSLLPKEVQTPVRKCIDAITKLFNSNGLKTAIVKVGRFIGELAEQIANLASNVIPLCTEVIGFLIDNFDTIAPLVITAVTAIKAYREATLLANMAQGMLNGTMSANPIGIIVGTVAALVTGIMTLTSWLNKTSDAEADLKKSQEELEKSQEHYEEATDNLADSLENAYGQMGKFQEGIDNAKSSLDGVDENLIIPEETKEKLEKDMQACQDKIDAVVKLASDERRELTQNEVDELDKLIEKQKSIAEQQLKLELNRADTAQTLAQAFVTDYGLSGNADDFLEQSQQYIKGAEEAEAKVTEAAEKTCSEQIAYAKTLVGTSKKYNEDWYNNQVKAAFKTKKETIEAAKKTTSQTVGIIEKHYQQLNFSGTQYLNDNKTINDNIAKADENYKKKLKSNGEWYNAEYAKINANQWDSSKKYAELKAKYEKKQEDATKEYTDTLAGYQTKLTEVWNEETGKEIDSILNLAKKTTEGGEKCSDTTARSVYETREALKNLPYDVREKLGDTYDEWIKAFDSLPPEMYEQGKAAAEALKKPTGRELSNDMSKNGEESITSLENGILSKIPGLSPVANIVANAIKNPTGRSLSNDMYTNGKNTVIGLINGVLSQLPGLSNVANIVASVFGGTYQGYNKINSPSKLMRSFGQYTVEGLELGLKDRAEKLAGIAKDLAESVSGTISSGLNNDIMLDTNAEMTARLKTAVLAQAGEIGLNVATKNANNYDTQSDGNSGIKASGNITTHINIDGREFAVATVPYIDEELAFIKG